MALVWSEKYSVGVPEMDAEHRRLIEMVNDLNEAMLQGKGRDVIGNILSRLINYTATHFKNEEAVMIKYNFPDYEEHKRKHEGLVQHVLKLQEDFKANRINVTLKVMNFLSNWVEKHIMGTDKKYGDYINSGTAV